jgi:methyl-accepting chemotaxis protein
MANLKRGEVTYTVDKNQGRIELYLPFGIGQTDARWTLMLQLPLDAVMADLQNFRLTSIPNANPTPSAWPWSAC